MTGYAPRSEYMAHVGSGPRQHPAMYHFAGGGPAGETCATCAAFLPASDKRRGRCARWIIHRGRGDSLNEREADPNWWRGLPCIAAASLSCKYWQAAP